MAARTAHAPTPPSALHLLLPLPPTSEHEPGFVIISSDLKTVLKAAGDRVTTEVSNGAPNYKVVFKFVDPYQTIVCRNNDPLPTIYFVFCRA